MEDSAILDLYFARSEQAIAETDRKYGPYCYSVAYHILEDRQDSEESVNDTYYSAWRGIPPRRPQKLGIFLGRITRNLAIDRWRRRTADKRGGGELPLVLEELALCVSGAESPETDLMRKEVTAALNASCKLFRRRTGRCCSAGIISPIPSGRSARKPG